MNKYIFRRLQGEKKVDYCHHIYLIMDETEHYWTVRCIATQKLFHSARSKSLCRKTEKWQKMHLPKNNWKPQTPEEFYEY